MTTSTTSTGLAGRIDRRWDDDILPTLTEYIRIPNVSKAFDTEWEAHGHMAEATELIRAWCAARPIEGLTVDVHRLPGLTPLIICEVPATDPALSARTVLLYGHLDKQPEMAGWRDGLGPWTPVIEDDKLYGRGGADDGYAAFAALVAIECAQAEGIAHARLVVLIEASEESGSPDLPAYVDALGDRLGSPELVICLDGGCLDDERLWLATSLRGLVNGGLTVEVLTAGTHSGQASGVVPSSFRIIRELLDRVEDSATGEVLLPALHVEIPADRIAAAADTAAAIDFKPSDEFPFAGSTRAMTTDAAAQFLAQTWHPTLSYIGADGFPPPDREGNVLRPWTRLTLSFRLPPTCDERVAADAIALALTRDPPQGAVVRFEVDSTGPGWAAPALAPWLEAGLDEASSAAFGAPHRSFGEGGSIPFMGMLGARFPNAQFVVTGALVPGSNAHGPDEFLHLPTARRVTECIARLLGAHASSPVP
jgi:acetylornithine deacetylase/succinyl-diaminopimelate desuccinylase-like protein